MKRFKFSYDWLLVAILIGGLLVRVIGLNWDDYSRLHPDERYMTDIVSRIGHPENLTDQAKARCTDPSMLRNYFNTDCSVWNPDNINLGSYVYGTLPLFIVNVAAQFATAINLGGLSNPQSWTFYDYVHLIGRLVNALADTISIFFVYLIGRRLFSSRHGLIAAALYAFAVLPIQLSHFWTVDIISHLFFLVAFYGAVEIFKIGRFWAYLIFGIALGAALASRINLYPMVVLLPLAGLLYVLGGEKGKRRNRIVEVVFLGAVSLSLGALTFRVFQPYAFVGPTINNWSINQTWFSQELSVSDLSRLPSDGWPPSDQWFGRIHYVYPWFNMAVWGMGLALGITGTVALIVSVSVQIRARRIESVTAFLGAWIVIYFAATGGIHVMTMRYYLQLYAPLCLLASWGLLALPRQSFRRVLTPAVMVLTALWAIAFVSIYTQPLTRVAASQWINDNLAPIIALHSADGRQVAVHVGRDAFNFSMQMAVTDESYISDPFTVDSGSKILDFEAYFNDSLPATGTLQLLDQSQKPLFEAPITVKDSKTLPLPAEQLGNVPPGTYFWHIQLHWDGAPEMRAFIPVVLLSGQNGQINKPVLFRNPYASVSYIGTSQPVVVYSPTAITAAEITIPHVLGDAQKLNITAGDQSVTAQRVGTSDNSSSPLGAGARYQLDQPITIQPNAPTTLKADGLVFFTGTVVATEGAWDDSLPVRFCNYTQIHWLIGLPSDCSEVNPVGFGQLSILELNMAETDSPAKRYRMIGALQLADYLTISSNRFYDALPRIPRRFSMSIEYYNRLFGGQLGYDLLQTVRHSPSLLGIPLPEQVIPTDHLPAFLNELKPEEAFTVYDHPTVFIFRNAGFNVGNFPLPMEPTTVTDESVNKLRVDLPALPAATYSLPINVIPDTQVILALATWTIGFLVLGWLTYPLLYTLLPMLPLRGFAIGRGVAWLALAFVAWWLTSNRLTFFWTIPGLWLLVLAFAVLSLTLAYRQRAELIDYLRSHWRAFLAIELLFVIAFGFGLLLRAVDPNLWDVARGGEKPMDFAYLNAVLRTPDFPPPNPWLAGYRINYYYFGFVVAALPIKLGGYPPEVGVNLVLGTLYAVIFTIFFTLAYSLLPPIRRTTRVALALCGTAFALVAGNFGTLKLILAPEPNMQPNRWYWYPTRVLGESANHGGGAINEMPIFSFLFGDLHAHILGLLPALLYAVVLWALVRSRRLWLGIPLGCLIGIILMTNTWDVLLYVPIGALCIAFATRSVRKFIVLGVIVAVSGIIAVGPYLLSYLPGEANGLGFWTGDRSLIEPFLLTWAIPIGICLFWILPRLHIVFFPNAARPLELGIIGSAVVILLALPPTWATTAFCLLLIVLGIVLAQRDWPSLRPIHLAVSFIFAALLSLEYIVVNGDVGRMNTVFKVSFQVWLWAGLLIPLVLYALLRERRYVLVALSIVLIGIGLLYPVYAIPARYTDNTSGHLALDGDQFLNPAPDSQFQLPPNEVNDLGLILYMRTIPGFPVVAEWYQTEYQWNSRISVQTGLPSVVGWANHLRQQYTALQPEIAQRISDIQRFYTSGDAGQMQAIINKYAINYIVFGELERSVGSPQTAAALTQMQASGELAVVYHVANTFLYQVVN